MKKRLITIAIFVIMAAMLFSAESIQLRNAPDAWNNITQAIDNVDDVRSNLLSNYNVSNNNDFQLITERIDIVDQKQLRYQQYYKNIPIWGKQVLLTKDSKGNIVRMHGELISGIEDDLGTVLFSQAITSTDIKEAMKEYYENNLKLAASELEYSNEAAKLVVFIDNEGKARLCYEVKFFVDRKDITDPQLPNFIVDAYTGEVLFEYDNLMHADGTGPGGNEKVGGYTWGTTYDPFEVTLSGNTATMKTDNVLTVNNNHSTSKSSRTPHSFTFPENTHQQINGAFCPLNDAHAFGIITFEMYQQWYNTHPIDRQLVLLVHYGNQYENAFWDPSNFVMGFGDGKDRFHPLVSLGILAHEVSHGFTTMNSNLTYSGQSGGINEAFSDMASEAAEYFWSDSTNYLIGDDIFKTGGFLRSMIDPPADGRSIDHVDNYRNGMDVHYSSGVYNKVYYVLATTSGWDPKKAFDVFVKANQDYWTASTNFQIGGQGALDAAEDLGYNTDDIKAAFRVVGVELGDVPPPPPPPQVVDLKNGEKVSGISGTQSEWKKYKIEVPADAKSLVFTMSGGSGDGDIYVRYGAEPTSSTYDYRPYNYGNNEQVNVATVRAGTYYAYIHGYSAFSGVSLVGKYTTEGGGGEDDLINGQAVPVSGPQGDYKYFKITVPAGTSLLQVQLTGGTGDCDLYVRYNNKPTRETYDYRSWNSSNEENINVTSPTSGTWYIMLYGYRTYSGAEIKATW